MLRSTIESHPDYENLRYGVKNMKELADYINANKNDADEINRILAIQDKLIGWPEVFIPLCTFHLSENVPRET